MAGLKRLRRVECAQAKRTSAYTICAVLFKDNIVCTLSGLVCTVLLYDASMVLGSMLPRDAQQ